MASGHLKTPLRASAFLTLQSVPGLYCVGDSSFPGQGVIAVAFSGIMCAHRVAADFGKHYSISRALRMTILSTLCTAKKGLPPQHHARIPYRTFFNAGIEPSNPVLDKLLSNLLSSFRGMVKPQA